MTLLAIALLFLGWLVWRTARQLEREARRVPARVTWVDVPGPVKMAYSSDGLAMRVTTPTGERVFRFESPAQLLLALELVSALQETRSEVLVQEAVKEVTRRLVAGMVAQKSQN